LASDIEELQKDTGLAVSKATTFLSIDTSGIQDTSGNNLTVISSASAQQVSTFTADATSPTLDAFTLSMDGTPSLTLTFSEIVKASEFDVSTLTIQKTANDAETDKVTLSGGSSSTTNSDTIVVTLSNADVDALKLRLGLAVSDATTFLRVASNSIQDMAGNNATATATDAAIASATFVADATEPTLTGFDFTMADGSLPLVISLTFSEPVLATSITPTAITIQNGANVVGSANAYTLTGGAVTGTNGRKFNITVTTTDVRAMRSNAPGLGATSGATFLSTSAGLAEDLASTPNANSVIATSSALRVTTHSADMTRPTLDSYSLDLDVRRLTLTFSEAVLADDLSTTSIALQSVQASSAISYTLTGSSTVSSTGLQTSVTVVLGDGDFNAMGAILALAESQSSTFLTISEGATLDRANNTLVAIDSSDALQVDVYTADATGPTLNAFSLNLTSSVLSLTFSETVNLNSLDLSGLTFQGSKTSDAEKVTLTGGTRLDLTTNESTVTEITLSTTDTNAIKRNLNLAVSNTTTFISSTGVIVRDVNAIASLAIASSDALAVTTFTADGVNPTLTAFSLDLNGSNTLSLTFDETMKSSTMNVTQITLQDSATQSAGASFAYTLTNSLTSTTDSTSITVTLSKTDFNAITARASVCSTRDNCFIVLTAAAGEDMAANPLTPITDGNGLQATSVVADSIGPRLLNFTKFDLENGRLTLDFDESINITSVDVSAITLKQFITAAATSYTLTGGSVTTVSNGPTVEIQLSTDDLNEIKILRDLCSLDGNCYISVTADLSKDMAGNANVAQAPSATLFAQTFVADPTAPTLSAFSVNVTSGEVRLTFSEAIDSANFKAVEITLQSSQNGATGSSHTLTGGVTSSNPGLVVVFTLTDSDLTAIKAIDNFMISTSTTFLSATSETITDMAGNKLTAVSVASALQASIVSGDSIAPELGSFILNLNAGTITLSFNEPVNTSTLNVNQLTLQGSADISGSGPNLTLTGGQIAASTSANGLLTIIVELIAADIETIKLTDNLATNVSTSFLSIGSTTIADMAGVAVTAIPNSAGLRAQEYVADVTKASIVSFSVNFQTNELTLTFDDVVDGTTLVASGIVLQDAKTASSGKQVALTSATVLKSATPSKGLELTLAIAASDVLSLIAVSGVASSRSNTFLIIGAETLNDIGGLDINALTNGNAIQATTFVADTVAPSLSAFHLNMNDGTLLLRFSEAVERSSFNSTQLTIQNNSSNPTKARALSASTTTQPGTNLDQFVVTLSDDDLDFLRLNEDIAVSEATTFVSITAGLVTDSLGAANVPIAGSGALQTVNFTADTTSPRLSSFNLNMTSGIIELVFDEVVKASSVSSTAVTLQSLQPLDTIKYTLTNSTSSTVNGRAQTITLGAIDLNALKSTDGLATVRANTFLTITSAGANDMADNQLEAIVATSALQVSTFTADNTAPTLTAFTLDMNSTVLLLTFDESIRASSVNPNAFTFQDATTATSNLTLSSSSTVSSANKVTISITLASADVDALKRNPAFAVSDTSTHLVFLDGAASDMAGNNLSAVSDGNAIQATAFIQDSIEPTITAFSLNMNTRSLLLTFSEVVNVTSIDATAVTLQSQADTSTTGDKITLSAAENVTSSDSKVVTIIIAADDVDAIKLKPTLAVGLDSSFLSTTAGLGKDMAQNSVQAILSTGGLQATAFTADTSAVSLSSFDLNLNTGVLTLSFSEPVDASTLATSQIILQSAANSSAVGTKSLGLTATSTTSSSDGRVIALSLSATDLNLVKVDTVLAVDRNSTFLSASSAAIKDISGNALTIISNSSALQVTTFTQDTASPSLAAIALDMTAGTLTLTFGETINASSLVVNALTIQSTAGSDATSVTLTGGSVTSVSSTVLRINLTAADLNALKLETELVRSVSSSFLSASASFVKDNAGVGAEAILTSAAAVIATYTSDTAAPTLVAFDLNMNSSDLSLTFSEVVNASSIDVTQIVLQNQRSSLGASSYTLTGGSPGTDNGLTITIALSAADANALRARSDLATTQATTFLFTKSSVVASGDGFTVISKMIADMFGNTVNVRSEIDALQVTTFTADQVAPSFTAFSINMNSGAVNLTLNRSVNVSSVVLTKFTFVEATDGANQHTLTNGTAVGVDSTTLTFTLSASDLNALKNASICSTGATCLLTVTGDALAGMSGVFVDVIPAANAFAATAHVADTAAPAFATKGFTSLDLNTKKLTITFTEAIKKSSASGNLNAITLASFFTNSPITVTLTGGTVESEGAVTELVITLSDADMTAITKQKGLCSTLGNCYISFTTSLVTDNEDNSVTPLSLSSATDVQSLTEDNVAPTLTAFDLNMNTAVLTLSFSEVMDSSSLSTDSITLQSVANTADQAQQYTLTGGSTTSSNGAVIVVDLSSDDVLALKANSNIAISNTTTFIAIASLAISDNAFTPNSVTAIASTAAKAVGAFTQDSTAPKLARFDLNMETALLRLTFNEPVRASVFNVSGLTVQNKNASATLSHQLTGATLSTTTDGVLTIEVTLNNGDITQLKSTVGLADSLSSTFLAVNEGAVRDMANNVMAEIPSSAALEASLFVVDASRVELSSFTVNFETAKIDLNFSDIVDASTFKGASFALQGSANEAGDAFYRLTTSTASSVDGFTLQISLSAADIFGLQSIDGVAKSTSNTFAVVEATFIDDIFGRDIVSITNGNGLQASAVVVDSTNPTLTQFSLNMSSGLLSLTFSESVNSTTLEATALTLQSAANLSSSGATSFTLTSGSAEFNSLRTEAAITLSSVDLNAIKLDETLCISSSSTFLSISSSLVQDLSGGSIDTIATSNAQAIQTFTPDTVKPVLSTSSLDMDTKTLNLTFTEPVLASSINISGVTLSNAAGDEFTLSASTTSSTSGLTISITLAQSDFDSLLASDIATSSSNAKLSLDTGFVTDMVQETLVAVSAASFNTFVKESTPPTLDSFTLNMANGEVSLTFSEVVRANTVTATALTIRSNDAGDGSRTLSGGTISTTNSKTILVTMTSTDIAEIKALRKVAISLNTSFMLISAQAAEDMSGNQVTSISTPLRASNFTPSLTGVPSESSTLSCVGARSGTTSVRAGEVTLCTITVNDPNGPTTGLASDFGSPITVGGLSPSPSSGVSFVTGGATMKFNLTAPATVGADFKVLGTIFDGTNFTQGFISLTVVGTPTDASTVSCAGLRSGTTTVRANELVICTITVRGSSGTTTGVAADFDSPTIIGGTNPQPNVGVSLGSGGATMTFNVTAPSVVGASFSVTGVLTEGGAFSQGAFSLTVAGTPTVASIINCAGTRSGTTSLRVGEEALCTITVNDASGATTGVATDFATPLVIDGSVTDPSSGVNFVSGGATMTFKVSVSTTVGDVTKVIGRLADGTNFTQGAFDLLVVGTPTASSTLACIGRRSQTTSMRVSEEVDCTITVRDETGTTSGVASDFASPLTIGGTNLNPSSGVTFVTGGATMTFSLQAPATVGETFQVFGRLADGTNFTQGAVELTVVGTPTEESTLACVGARSGTTSLRINEVATCTITVRDGTGATTGVASDFGNPVLVGGLSPSPSSGVGFVSGGATMTFNVTAPGTVGADFQVMGALASGTNFTQGFVTLVVVGTPTSASTLACVGRDSGTSSVRVSVAVVCTITVNDDSGATTGVASDFTSPIVIGGIDVQPSSGVISVGDGSTMTFNVTSPSTVGATFEIIGVLADDSNFTQGAFSMTVVGSPSVASTISCAGSRSGTTSLRAGEEALCTIAVKDDGGLSTTGVATDFATPLVIDGSVTDPSSGVNFVSGGATMTFKVSVSTTVGDVTKVIGRLADGTNFTQGAFDLLVVGTPTASSTLACIGRRSQTTSMRVSEEVDCTITVRDETGTTSGVASDFASPLTIGGTNLNPSSGVTFVTGGATMTFSLQAPATVGETFQVFGRLADGTNFTQGAVELTVVGTPTEESTLACVGARSGTTSLRINEVATCTITVRDGTGATTGVASDFGNPVLVGGLSPSPSSGVGFVSGGATMTFNVTAPGTVGADFQVMGALASGTNFTQGFVTLVVVGTPTSASTLACVGSVSQAGLVVRAAEVVDCTITVNDDSGTTTGVAADFATPHSVGGTSPSPSSGVAFVSGGATMTFQLTAPSVGETFEILGQLADGTNFTEGPLSLTVGMYTCRCILVGFVLYIWCYRYS
jgi:hypothetical protein